jgi:hypothetical protein
MIAKVKLYTFLTLALDGNGWSLPSPNNFMPRKRALVSNAQEAE